MTRHYIITSLGNPDSSRLQIIGVRQRFLFWVKTYLLVDRRNYKIGEKIHVSQDGRVTRK